MKFEVAFGDNVLKSIGLYAIAVTDNFDWAVFIVLLSLEEDIEVDLMCSFYHEELIEDLFFCG